jgi:hypothetical protein
MCFQYVPRRALTRETEGQCQVVVWGYELLSMRNESGKQQSHYHQGCAAFAEQADD